MHLLLHSFIYTLPRPTQQDVRPIVPYCRSLSFGDCFLPQETLNSQDTQDTIVKKYKERISHTPKSFVMAATRDWIQARKRLNISSEQSFVWDTKVHELRLPNGAAVRLRRYTNAGDPQGPAILFLPGSSNVPYGGDPYLENCAQAPYPLFSLDRPYIKNGRVDMDIEAQMQQIKMALRYLYEITGQKVHIVGFSLGGFFAANLASQCPEETKSLMLISPSMPTPDTFQNYLNRLDNRVKTPKVLSDLRALTLRFPDVLHQIKAPTALFLEENYIQEKTSAMELIRKNIPNPIEEVQVFHGPLDGKHMITLSKLNAMDEWWQRLEDFERTS